MTAIEVPNAGAPGAASTQSTSAGRNAAWARCLDGDRDAFHELVGVHLDELFESSACMRDHVPRRLQRSRKLANEYEARHRPRAGGRHAISNPKNRYSGRTGRKKPAQNCRSHPC